MTVGQSFTIVNTAEWKEIAGTTLTESASAGLSVRKKLNSLISETKITEFANRVDLDEVAHHEPPHLDLHCLSSSFLISQYDIVWT